jgi:hypothetical protein
MVVTGIVYALLGTGIYCHYQGKSYFSDYKKSTSVESANYNFDRAQKFSDLSKNLLIAGGTIWTIDVGQVIVKGIRNRKMQKDILKRRQK